MELSRREELAKQAPAPSATTGGTSELLEDLQRKVESRRQEGKAEQAAPAPSSGQAPASSSGASELLEDVRRCQEARKESEASSASKGPSTSVDRDRELLKLLQASAPPTSNGTSELLEDLRRRQEETLRKEKASPASNSNNGGSAERDRELLTALVRQDLQNTLLQRELQRRQLEQQARGDSEKPGMTWP